MSSLQLGTLLLTLAMVAGLDSTAVAQTTPGPEPQIKRILSKLENDWNAGDSAGWGGAFTEDADFINILGEVFDGRKAITQLLATRFNGKIKGTHTTVTMRQFKQVTSDVVVVEALHEATKLRIPPPGITLTQDGALRTWMKYVFVKRDDRWQIVSAQNTAILPSKADGVH